MTKFQISHPLPSQMLYIICCGLSTTSRVRQLRERNICRIYDARDVRLQLLLSWIAMHHRNLYLVFLVNGDAVHYKYRDLLVLNRTLRVSCKPLSSSRACSWSASIASASLSGVGYSRDISISAGQTVVWQATELHAMQSSKVRD